MPHRVRLPLLLAACLALGALAPAPGRADSVDRYLEGQMRALHLPGLSVAIVRDGRVVKARGYGYANLESKTPATAATAWEIGSATKQFTAAAVLLLVQDGRLALDDPVTKHLPEAPVAWSGITLRHLLHHTSGIRNHVAVPGWMRVFRTGLGYDTTPARDELLAKFFELPSEFEPGESWAYDNTGYYLLGVIVERTSGRTYWEFLEERVFGPLGMSATRSTDPRPLTPHRASGYEWTGEAFENRPVLMPDIALSAGAILSTVGDMAKWDAALRSEKLLPRELRELLWTPARTRDGGVAPFDYGFGWFVDRWRGRRLALHGGGTPGFACTIHRWLDDGLAVILLSNHGDRFMDQLAIDVAGLVSPELRRPRPGVDPDPATTARLRAIVAGLAEERRDPADFTPAMNRFLDSAVGIGMWKGFAWHGAMTSFELADAETVEGARVLRHRLALGGAPYWLTIRVEPDGRVSQILWW